MDRGEKMREEGCEQKQGSQQRREMGAHVDGPAMVHDSSKADGGSSIAPTAVAVNLPPDARASEGGQGCGDAAKETARSPGATLLLSSSNDSTITLWDINRHHCASPSSSTRRRRVQASGSPSDTVPRVVCELAGVHRQGIFGMHERGLLVAAASKDKTVSVSRVGPTALTLDRVLAHHDAAVRAVHLRDSHVFVDGAADGSMAVVDMRAAAPVAIAMGHCHATQVNTVHWQPTTALLSGTDGSSTTGVSSSSGSNIVVSSSFDHALLVHDIRVPATPLFALSGHHRYTGSLSTRPSKQIVRPAFVDGGRFVVVPVPLQGGGGGSGVGCRVALYSMDTGKLVSCGTAHVHATLAFALDSTGAARGGGEALRDVWLAGASVAQFRPLW
ncbi:hypothetical protein CLOM_g14459 [Closterium sp. NIES-68]|nr:hypothetical protein CLOM_g14459 [Closterium sp. NIES-68]